MSISSFGFFEKLKLASVYSSKAQEKGLPVDLLSDLDKIDALEMAIKKNPNEWVYWYALADNQMALGWYSLTLSACEKCVNLKPDDPRSTYAMETLYRVLTRARFINNPKAKEVQNVMSVFGSASGLRFDPELSANGLKQIGMTVEEAAKKSIQYFEKTLKLRVNSSEAQHVKSILQELYEDFPPFKEQNTNREDNRAD